MHNKSLEKIIFELRRRNIQEAYAGLYEAFVSFFNKRQLNWQQVTTCELQNIFCHDPLLCKHLADLCLCLQRGSCNDYAKVYSLLRKALCTRAYHEVKADECVFETKFTHDLVVSSYMRPNLFRAYEPFTNLFSQSTGSFYESLQNSRNMAIQCGAHSTANSFTYMKNHANMLFKAFLSTPFAKPITFLKPYDPRLHFHNVSGKAFVETLDIENRSCTATTLYTPSPTVGVQIAPEMRAFLQALKNRKLGIWRFVNLQDATSFHERARALAIMDLSAEFPEVFSCCSISQDKGLYQVRPNSKEAIVQLLLHEANFSKKTKTGYYFPGDKKQWQDAIPFVVEQAMLVCDEKQDDERQALYELIHLGLIRYFQLHNLESNVIFSSTCKESIDRGGKINALFLWALSNDEALSHSAFHVRALVVRSRLMQKRRFDEALHLIRHVSKKEVRLFLDKIAKTLGVNAHEATF